MEGIDKLSRDKLEILDYLLKYKPVWAEASFAKHQSLLKFHQIMMIYVNACTLNIKYIP